MNKISLSLLSIAMLLGSTLLAQTTTKTEKKEITIEKKENGKKEKMVIVIDGDNVTIDGKPAEDYKGTEMIIIDKGSVIVGDRVIKSGKGSTTINGRSIESSRPLLGVTTEKIENGALIEAISDGSGAEKAGLKKGDIITGINKSAIKSPEDLMATIGKSKPGDVVDVDYIREGKKKKTKATLGKTSDSFSYNFNTTPDAYSYRFEMPRTPIMPKMPKWNENDFKNLFVYNDRPKYGMSIQDDEDNRGVKVTDVDEEGNASKGGLKEDDIITELDAEKVIGVDAFRELLDTKKDKTSISLKVLRNGQTQNLTIKVPRKLKSADL
jgi:serine protease Do